MAIPGPHLIEANNPGHAWLAVSSHVLASHNEVRNLLVTIHHPTDVDLVVHDKVESFCRFHDLHTPKHVAYAVFPKGLARGRDASQVFDAYNRPRGFFAHVKTGWGTYFRRMTSYEQPSGPVNQLGRIIDAVNSRKACHRAAYTLVVQQPGGETVRARGGPCLNYLALQIEPGEPRTTSLLAVYRNHDVLERVYGNYLGLGWLLAFLCDATRSQVGQLTCVSSHAYINRKVRAFRTLVESIAQP